jgi:23S rRNA (pseudouridine1915-N3)-methyltransferase
MIKVNIVAVGKVKEKYFDDGIKEYSKRLSRFCNFNIIEVQEENRVKVSAGDIAVIKKVEGECILPHLKGKVFAMAIEGKAFSSESFAKKIEACSLDNSEITFVIGGSYGLADEVKKRAELISFSPMTFPHTLFSLMLTEQIYRAFMQLSGSSYHK